MCPVCNTKFEGSRKRTHSEGNLELLCPSCHSLTPSYGGRNKGNGRKTRYRLEKVEMGLRDDDAQIFAERDLLDWAKEYPESPGSYDYRPTEEEVAAHEYAVRKWREKKPQNLNGGDGSGYRC